MSYGPTHARAYRLVKRKGAAVTFTRITRSHTASTGRVSSPVATSIIGVAVRDEGDPKRYARLTLISTEAVTLFFVPRTFGQLPKHGDACNWGNGYTVRDVDPVAPSGVVIGASVVVSK